MSDHDFQYLEVGDEVYDKVRMLAGPYGKVIHKIMEAKCEQKSR